MIRIKPESATIKASAGDSPSQQANPHSAQMWLLASSFSLLMISPSLLASRHLSVVEIRSSGVISNATRLFAWPCPLAALNLLKKD